MDFLGIFLVASLSMLRTIHGYAGGWSSARATFYGGGDASGTMGEMRIRHSNYTLENSVRYYFKSFFHFLFCVCVLQEELVAMEIFTAKVMAQAQQH